MKKNYAFFVFGVLLLCLSCNGNKNTPEENIEKEDPIASEKHTEKQTIDYKPLTEQPAAYFMASPNGEYILFSNENAQGIKLFDSKTSKEKTISENGSGFDATWIDNNTIIFKEKTNDYRVLLKKYELPSNTFTTVEASENLLPSSFGKDTKIYLNKKPISITIEQLNKEAITINSSRPIYAPLVNYNQELLLLHEGTEMKLYNFKGELIDNLGNGLATSWSSDGKNLLYFIDHSDDGHEITSSTIHSYNTTSKTHKKLLDNVNIIAAYPYFINDSIIIYRDLKTHKQKIIRYE